MKKESKEKAIIYYTSKNNVNNMEDCLINYCSDKHLEVIYIYEIVAHTKRGSKKILSDILAFIMSITDRIHIVCNDFYDIFQDVGDLQILEPLITTGKITIHILKQNFIIDKNSYDADMVNRINIMLLTRYCYINTLSHNIKAAKNHKKKHK